MIKFLRIESKNIDIDTITRENQSEVIKNRIFLHSLSTICYIKDVSNKLNKNISIIFLE